MLIRRSITAFTLHRDMSSPRLKPPTHEAVGVQWGQVEGCLYLILLIPLTNEGIPGKEQCTINEETLDTTAAYARETKSELGLERSPPSG
jgi:hypothetical protein